MIDDPRMREGAGPWRKLGYCGICMTWIRAHHMRRHNASKGHQTRAGVLDLRASDHAFTSFLKSVRYFDLTSGHERKLYAQYRSEFLRVGN